MRLKEFNALYSCCSATPWIDVVQKLDAALNIKPAYFIGREEDGSQKINERYSRCFFQTLQDAWKGLGFPELDYKFSLDETFLKSIAFEELMAIKMMDRLDVSRHDFSFSDRQYFFHQLLKYWLVILDEYSISLVISPSIPHRVFDFALYVAAKIKNVEFIMFQMTPFADSSYIINDISRTTDYMKHEIGAKSLGKNLLRKDIVDRINSVKKDYRSATPDYMVKQQIQKDDMAYRLRKLLPRIVTGLKQPWKLFEQISSYHVKKNHMPSHSKTLRIEALYNRYKNRRYLRKLAAYYERICTKQINQKYVFVALHYQPEETSSPTGGSFVDQLLILEVLHAFLEDDYEIIVKEHKTQFHPDYEGSSGRSCNFYRNALKISDRVKFVSTAEDPFTLIDNAAATVTISGTIGWESVIRGTPSLIFGRAWYEDMPGVFKIKSISDLADTWGAVLSLKNNINPDAILNYHEKLQSYFINAAHYDSFKNKVSRSDEENCMNIFNGIKQHLESIDFNNK